MSFSIVMTSRKDTNGAIVHAVLVTIDGHETVLTFVSKLMQRASCKPSMRGSRRTKRTPRSEFVKSLIVFGRRKVVPRAKPCAIGLVLRPFSRRSRPSTNEARRAG